MDVHTIAKAFTGKLHHSCACITSGEKHVTQVKHEFSWAAFVLVISEPLHCCTQSHISKGIREKKVGLVDRKTFRHSGRVTELYKKHNTSTFIYTDSDKIKKTHEI